MGGSGRAGVSGEGGRNRGSGEHQGGEVCGKSRSSSQDAIGVGIASANPADDVDDDPGGAPGPGEPCDHHGHPKQVGQSEPCAQWRYPDSEDKRDGHSEQQSAGDPAIKRTAPHGDTVIWKVVVATSAGPAMLIVQSPSLA